MKKDCAERYLKILELSKNDPKYLEYFHSYKALNDDMRILFDQLSFQDSILISDYFGLREAMEMRLLEIACEQMDFPKS